MEPVVAETCLKQEVTVVLWVELILDWFPVKNSNF